MQNPQYGQHENQIQTKQTIKRLFLTTRPFYLLLGYTHHDGGGDDYDDDDDDDDDDEDDAPAGTPSQTCGTQSCSRECIPSNIAQCLKP